MKNELDLTTEYITRRYLDYIFSGSSIGNHEIADEVERVTSEPNIGDHLVTPRSGYTHHGLYIGGGKVIHYEGLYKGLKSGPVTEICLSKFGLDKKKDVGFFIESHDHKIRSIEDIVAHARSRLGEESYNLVWNNCEHFVHDCIYGVSKSNQVNDALKLAAKNVVKGVGKSNAVAQSAIAAAELKSSFMGYLKGEISGKKLIEDVSHTAISSASMGYYGVLGQAAIPVPVVGFLVGSSIGFVIGNAILSSGHLSLGETAAVKASRERYEEVKALCDVLIPKVQESRNYLEVYLEKYFSERREEIGEALLKMEVAANEGNMESFTVSLDKVNSLFGASLHIKNFEEFDDLMLSDVDLKF